MRSLTPSPIVVLEMSIFKRGNSVVVTTRGPGHIHLLSYDSNSKLTNHVGVTPTSNTGETRFLISHSYTFTKYAFYWDGAGEAVYGIGTGLERRPVGRSWTSASMVSWGSRNVTTGYVSSLTTKISGHTEITAFVIPDKI